MGLLLIKKKMTKKMITQNYPAKHPNHLMPIIKKPKIWTKNILAPKQNSNGKEGPSKSLAWSSNRRTRDPRIVLFGLKE